jgi:hypothetical protein
MKVQRNMHTVNMPEAHDSELCMNESKVLDLKKVQCSLHLPFFKGREKMIGECEKTVNRKTQFLTEKVVHCLLLLGRILPLLKIRLFEA